jgi:Asp-tRNA(Asn)/Glu-tRNA(Gln) amidotransferase A subunit family amidase
MFTTKINLGKTLEDLKNNKNSLQAYVHEICDRIEECDSNIHSLLPEPNRRSRLLKEAEELEKRYPNLEDRPPLYGALVGIKDVLRADGFLTKAGSKLPENLFDGPEAKSVTLLRESGALILGKTVTTEFAFFEPGPTVNPHNVEHTPGGSSSGSAAAVAAGFCSLALGTQTIGSVIRPAAFCGVVGFKPSLDQIPTDGLLHFSRSMDHIGFFTQDVEGVDIAASVLCKDWISQEQLRTTAPTLGVPEGPYLAQMPSDSLVLFESHLKRLSEAGYVIKRVSVFEDIERINQLHRDWVISELAEEHVEWFAQYESLYRPFTKQSILDGQNISKDTAEEARKVALDLRKSLEEVMDQNGIDLWVCPPALGPAPKGIQSTGDPIMNLPWTNTGMPAITFPADKAANGLPIGLQFVAPYMKDEQLVGWSKALAGVFNHNDID